MSFSSDGRWLVSLGRDPERSVVVWDLSTGQAAAIGRTRHQALAAAWLLGTATPKFVTAGGDGLLLWSLRDDCMEQSVVALGEAPEGAPEEHVTATSAVTVDDQGHALVADVRGAVWEVQVGMAVDTLCVPIAFHVSDAQTYK